MPTFNVSASVHHRPWDWEVRHYQEDTNARETRYGVQAIVNHYSVLHVCGLSRAELESLHAAIGQTLQDAAMSDADPQERRREAGDDFAAMSEETLSLFATHGNTADRIAAKAELGRRAAPEANPHSDLPHLTRDEQEAAAFFRNAPQGGKLGFCAAPFACDEAKRCLGATDAEASACYSTVEERLSALVAHDTREAVKRGVAVLPRDCAGVAVHSNGHEE